MSVLVVPRTPTLSREIVLVPPLELGCRRQRRLTCRLAADQITAHGHHRLAALGPQSSDDVGGPRSPIKTSKNGLLDLERVHQRDHIESDGRLLSVTRCLCCKKPSRAIASQMRNDHPEAGGR